MKIEQWAIDKPIPYDRNPRKISDEAVNQVANSLSEAGWQQPIVVNKDGVIIVGHTRLKAAKKLGMKEVPVLVADLTKEQEDRYRLRDNKSGEFSQWDIEMLGIDWEAPELEELGFDLGDMGIDMPAEEGLTDEDEVPEPPAEPISKEGDLWILGGHRLMCGDSTSPADATILLDGEKANMCFTDPPYLMDFTGGIHADGSKSFNAKHGGILNDKMSKSDGDKFLDDINENIKNNVTGAFFITFYRLGIDWYFESLNRVGLETRSLIIWSKGNHTLSNSDFMSNYEPMFYGWVDEHNFYGGNNGMDIWEISRTKKNDLHPTMKPVELVEKAIGDGSARGNTVLDLFGGSGTTLIACEKTSRKCRMMELDPKYIDVIITRWQDFTGKKAVHENGKTFEELSND